MRKETLFVYGTLKDGDIRRALFGGRPTGELDALEGYARTTTDIGGVAYPNIAPAIDGRVDGEVLEVDREALQRVDQYEAGTYARRRFLLRSGRRAWAYIRE